MELIALKNIAPKPTDSERFWAKVDRSGDCWTWSGYRNKFGYGIFCTRGADRRNWLAHRYSHETVVAPIPSGMVIDHRCHNTACVRPDHLRAVTHKQNSENRSGATKANTASGVRGVHRRKDCDRWIAAVVHNGKNHYLGLHETVAEAEAAVTAKRLELFTHNDLDRKAA